jgi:hypothetical protein
MRIRHERQRLVEVLMSTAPVPGRQMVSPDAIACLDRCERRAE